MNTYDRILEVTPALFRKPVILAILRAAATSIDALEEARESIELGLAIETASGVMLDRFGALYEVPRGTMSDPEYRAILAAFRAAHASHGEREALIRVLLAVTGAERVIVSEAWPAGISIELVNPTLDAEKIRLMWLALDRAVNSGITIIGVRVLPDPNLPYFGWHDDPNAAPFDVGTWREYLPGGL